VSRSASTFAALLYLLSTFNLFQKPSFFVMVQLSAAFLGLVAIAASVNAAPLLEKRIAQVIADSTAKWETACVCSRFIIPWLTLADFLFDSSLPVEDHNAIRSRSLLSPPCSLQPETVTNRMLPMGS
jgi:hypothetical protein